MWGPVTACVLLAVVVALAFLAARLGTPGEEPEVKSNDAIDEEIRREKLELHNRACEYADSQLKGYEYPMPTPMVSAMLVSAFKMGARWQQRRR
jgi:hypothetical protein